MKSITFALIKPDVVKSNRVPELSRIIRSHDFNIVIMALIKSPCSFYKEFYAEHEGKPFYNDLMDFMCNDSSYGLVLNKPGCDAVTAWRTLMGPTDPKQEAEGGVIRKMFGTSMPKNAVHGSDSHESVSREIELFSKNVTSGLFTLREYARSLL